LAQALGGTGYSGTAQFTAPVVDPNTWQGNPIGTGTWSAQSTPAQSGGTQAIAAVDSASSPGQTYRYVVVGNFATGSGRFFAVISDQPFAVGAAQVDNQHLFAGLFDAVTGEPVALADSGTVTFTQVGGLGGTVDGTFSGTLDDVQAGCTTNADCAAGQVCSSNTCVAATPSCTTSADCAAGQVCSSGACVAIPGGCTSSTQCPAGASCIAGVCSAAGCTSDADCAARESCLANTCVPSSGGCSSSAQCPSGMTCQAGACVGGNPGSCGAQGTGSYSGSATVPMTCSALGNGAISLTNGMAYLGSDQTGSGIALYVLDPNGRSDGVVLPLSACPSGPGPLQASGQVYASGSNAGPGVTLVAVYDASGTVNFTGVGHYTGTFSLTLTGGGTVSGSFDLQ
jgi:Cys-rich repeat protein